MMPRPLIIKIDNHKAQQNKKATGSIDFHLLKENRTKSTPDVRIYQNDQATDNDDRSHQPRQNRSTSVVRSLISRYESSNTKTNLLKHKSKSLADIQKPHLSITPTKTSQDDFLYNTNQYQYGQAQDKGFDFRKVWSKFETSSYLENKDKSVSSHPVFTEKITSKVDNFKYANGINRPGIEEIKQKAQLLLEIRPIIETSVYDPAHSSWHDQTVELLQQIVDLQDVTEQATKNVTHQQKVTENVVKHEEKGFYSDDDTEENDLRLEQNEIKELASDEDVPELSLGIEETDKKLKVKDIKSIFETNVNVKPFSRSISAHPKLETVEKNTFFKTKLVSPTVPLKYFGKETEDDSLEDKDNPMINYTPTQSSLSSIMKIQELTRIFQANTDKYISFEESLRMQNGGEGNKEIGSDISDSFSESSESQSDVMETRLIPPPKIVILDEEVESGDIESSKQQIEELTKDIEDYNNKINTLSKENKEEGSYINEVLIRILIKLDDIKTYGDELILSERKRALVFTQNCIKKLKDKIHGAA